MEATIQRRPASGATDALLEAEPNPLLRRVFAARDIVHADQLDLSLSGLLPPSLLLGLDRAIELLADAVLNAERILLVGDFDADGATSCALAVRALNDMGHDNVRFLVPNRFDYGYGLTPEIVALAGQLSPNVIVTVDNGISSIDGVAAAKAAGIKVVVTDHHLPGSELPAADAIVNPNQPGCGFPSKALAGVGVIFYVMSALRAQLRTLGWFADRPEPAMAKYLDLVALGTVADVVPLDHNNRILVEQGLRRIRGGECCAGIKALFQVARRIPSQAVTSDIGFALGPRINAAGRLDDISMGIACLLTDSFELARDIALQLDAINRDRRDIEQGMLSEAESQLGQMLPGDEPPNALCLYSEGWHQGVIGILASRVKERLHRPVICFAPADESPDCAWLKGSARSIPGFHIRDALDQVAAEYPGLLEKFGGHAMAAGLTIERENLQGFERAFAAVATQRLSDDDLKKFVLTDGALSSTELTLDQARTMNQAMPWGQGFPEPLFDGEFHVIEQRLVGEKHLKMLLRHPDHPGMSYEAIAFGVDVDDWPNPDVKTLRIAYRMDINRYRGNETLQLVVAHMEVPVQCQ